MTFDPAAQGIAVSELKAQQRRLTWPRNSRCAFIGRALRGPVDTPVLINGVGAFQRRFGGPWRQSGLYHGVEQFFAHGGRELYVVRVANGAAGAELELPGPAGMLKLTAAEPGSAETLRVAVDYDGIADEQRFNLAIQRLAPQSGVVIDQEIHSGIDLVEDSPRFIGNALGNSTHVRLAAPRPTARPYATMGPLAQARSPYLLATTRGKDGEALSDYDLIGSRERRTGIFSLEAVDDVDLLYLPPPGPERDPGPMALLAAESYCRARGAMLIADPAAQWEDAASAAAGVRDDGLARANVMTYFPRLTIGAEKLPAGAAIAGLLCRLDAEAGPWSALGDRRYRFRHGARPVCDVSGPQRQILARAGVNAIVRDRDGRFDLVGNVTRARAEQSDPFYTDLSVRRFCLRLAKVIEKASRRALVEGRSEVAASDVERLASELLESLENEGALEPGQSRVRCTARVADQRLSADRSLTTLLTLRPARVAAPVSMTLYHTFEGCTVSSTAFAPVESSGARASAA